MSFIPTRTQSRAVEIPNSLIDHFEKDWVREFTHGIVGSFGGQMLARTRKYMENKRNPGKLIGITVDECVPGATVPGTKQEE